MDILKSLRGEIIVSSQAMRDDYFYNPEAMFAMINSVVQGGANFLRLAGERDISYTKKNFNGRVGIIGITKPDILPENYKEIVYITPTVDDVVMLSKAGADIIAFDATMRDRVSGNSISDIISEIKSQNKFAMADISTEEEGINAFNLGADIISTTLNGYTTETASDDNGKLNFKLLKNLVKKVSCPVIAEGRIWTVEAVKEAFNIGAYAVVIGSAITRPHLITKHFIEGVKNEKSSWS